MKSPYSNSCVKKTIVRLTLLGAGNTNVKHCPKMKHFGLISMEERLLYTKNAIPTVIYSDGNTMLCGCFIKNGNEVVHVIERTINSAIYKCILNDYLFFSAEYLKVKNDWVF